MTKADVDEEAVTAGVWNAAENSSYDIGVSSRYCEEVVCLPTRINKGAQNNQRKRTREFGRRRSWGNGNSARKVTHNPLLTALGAGCR